MIFFFFSGLRRPMHYIKRTPLCTTIIVNEASFSFSFSFWLWNSQWKRRIKLERNASGCCATHYQWLKRSWVGFQPPSWDSTVVFWSILETKSVFISFETLWIPRELNSSAHDLCVWARKTKGQFGIAFGGCF